MDSCSACQRFVSDIAALAALAAHSASVPQERAPDELRERLLQAASGDRSSAPAARLKVNSSWAQRNLMAVHAATVQQRSATQHHRPASLHSKEVAQSRYRGNDAMLLRHRTDALHRAHPRPLGVHVLLEPLRRVLPGTALAPVARLTNGVQPQPQGIERAKRAYNRSAVGCNDRLGRLVSDPLDLSPRKVADLDLLSNHDRQQVFSPSKGTRIRLPCLAEHLFGVRSM